MKRIILTCSLAVILTSAGCASGQKVGGTRPAPTPRLDAFEAGANVGFWTVVAGLVVGIFYLVAEADRLE